MVDPSARGQQYPHPKTIYDFGGFPPHLSQLVYPAPGNPALATRVVDTLAAAGFKADTDSKRGFDHGVWTPLILMDPAGKIPVTQLSIQPHRSPADHWQLGQALQPLRDEGVLIIGSGAATHNLWAFGDHYEAAPPTWAIAFDQWLAKTLADGDTEQLLNYRQVAPHASQNHPTEEHLLPLFVAAGAGGTARQIHQGFTYGAFSMAAYAFD